MTNSKSVPSPFGFQLGISKINPVSDNIGAFVIIEIVSHPIRKTFTIRKQRVPT